MAQVDPLSRLQATAVGGPIAGAEYAAAQKATNDTRQQALSDAASRAGAVNAPQQFINSQVGRLDAPLSAAVNALGSNAGAANAYSGALNAAQGQYAGALQASQGLLAQKMKYEMERPGGTYSNLKYDLAERQYTQDRRARMAAEQQQKAAMADGLKEASVSGLDPESFDTLKKITAANDSLPLAIADLNSRVAPVLDENGNPVNDNQGRPIYTAAGNGKKAGDPEGVQVPSDSISAINSWLLSLYGGNSPELNRAVGQNGLDATLQTLYGQ